MRVVEHGPMAGNNEMWSGLMARLKDMLLF